MKLTEAKQLAYALMLEHGLVSVGWRFKFDNAVIRLGLCKHSTKTISISKPITRLNDVAQVRNTLLHEIAHALVGRNHGHNATWRFKAISIGCNGQRCTNSVVSVDPKYKIVCAMCGTSWPCHRKPRRLDVSWHKTCGRASQGKLSIWTA